MGVVSHAITAPQAEALGAPRSIPAFGYECLSGSNINCQTGENQFYTKLTEYSPTQVLFSFFNKGSQPSSIARIYFDDTGPFFSLGKVINVFSSSGVNFSTNYPGPNNLPGGRSVQFTADFSAGATAPVQPNGINPGEVVSILFDVTPGFNDPFNAVVTDLRRGGLRVGLHAIGFEDGGSESFVNGAVPEPMTMVGTGVAIGAGMLLKRRKAALQKRSSEDA